MLESDATAASNDLERQLALAARSAPEGDSRAFEQLILLHQRKILANCRYLARDESNYEDLAQEVFVKAYFGIKTFEGNSSFGHWLRRIKVNHCLNHLKRNEGRFPVDIADEAILQEERLQVPPIAESRLDAADQRNRIHTILGMMPIGLRIPLIMRDMDDFSYDEVASALGLGLSAVKMRIKRARELFRKNYKPAEGRVAHES